MIMNWFAHRAHDGPFMLEAEKPVEAQAIGIRRDPPMKPNDHYRPVG